MATRQKSFRFRAYPTQELLGIDTQWEDALRFLWNIGNEQHKLASERYRTGSFCKQEIIRDTFIDAKGKEKKSKYLTVTAFSQSNEMTELREMFPWLAAVPRNVCNQLLVELDKAWQRLVFGLAKEPKFKKKGVGHISFCEPHPRKWRLDISEKNPEVGWLKFPKLSEPIRVVVHRPLEGTPKTCTLKRDGDQWFVSISCEIEVADPVPRFAPKVAIDRGITNAVGTSDGVLIRGPQYLKQALKQLARAQRTVDRRKKGSQNYKKAQRRVMQLHRLIRRQRAHFLHTLSARFTKSHGVLVFEKLNLAGMMRGNCARGLADAGLGMFVNFCHYKMEWSGGLLQFVDAKYSSQECFACEHVDAKSRRGEVFCCTKCGHTDHADINAAKVLLRRANRSVLPVDGLSGGSLQDAKRSRKVEETKKLRVARRSSGTSIKLRP